MPDVPLLTGTVFREFTRPRLYFDEQFPSIAELWQYAGSAAEAPTQALQQGAEAQGDHEHAR